MKHIDRSTLRPHRQPNSLSILTVLSLTFLLFFTLNTPLQATQRMVLGEELTNNT